MKILLMNNSFPSEIHPQVTTYIPRIKECLVIAGAQVELLVMPYDFKTSIGKFFHYAKFYLKILFFNKFNDFDAVVLNHYPHFAIPFLFKMHKTKQLIIHWHGGDLLPEKKYKKALFLLFHQILLKKKWDTIHISPSKYFSGEISRLLKIEKEKIIISPSGGIKTESFTPVKKNSDNKIIIGFASGLVKEKGAELLIELIKFIPELEKSLKNKIEFSYISYGAEKEKYDAVFQKSQNVIKWNTLKAEKMSEFYNSIDILLFPTLRPAESLGLVALEAMCCNKPVIGTNRFAIPEYIISGLTGETFEFNDFNSLKFSLINCIKNIANYSPRKFILDNYSQEKVIEDYKEIFEKISH